MNEFIRYMLLSISLLLFLLSFEIRTKMMIKRIERLELLAFVLLKKHESGEEEQ